LHLRSFLLSSSIKLKSSLVGNMINIMYLTESHMLEAIHKFWKNKEKKIPIPYTKTIEFLNVHLNF